MKIAIIGAGMVGASWATAFAAGGHDVTLFDADGQQQDAGLARALAALAVLPHASADTGSIEPAADLASALGTADYVQECIAEDLPAKRALFERIDACLGPETVVGSSTSSIAGSDFMGGLSISPRCLVVHPTNPPHIIPLVELCRLAETTDRSFELVQELLRSTNRVGVEIRREIPGYVLNRLQAAVVGEALHLVGEGYISANDLDRVMALGLAPRWALGGPFLAGHLNAPGGYRDYMTRFANVYRGMIADLHVDYSWTPELIEAIDAELSSNYAAVPLATLNDRRDAALIALEQILVPLRQGLSKAAD